MAARDAFVFSQALNLRHAIEGRCGGDTVGPLVLDLVAALGGQPDVMIELSGKPSAQAAYLVALLLTNPNA